MGDRHWQIGVCGTFDVANYGDLLFPVIAESELTERLGPLTLHRFSYGAKTPPTGRTRSHPSPICRRRFARSTACSSAAAS
jgi:hypothetical protein